MNRRILAKILATALAAFSFACFIAGCKSSGTFTEADAGRTFKTSPGAAFDVQLKGNYTTGFSWDVAPYDGAIVQIAGGQYVPNQPQKPGSGGVQHYAFNVVGKGRTTLQIIYHRAWEKNVPPALTFTLQIDSK